MTYEHECTADNAARFLQWIKFRGGVSIWNSINLSNPGASWSTPALTEDGQPTPKPTWEAENTPSKTITDPARIGVIKPMEIKRFHVAVRRSSNGLMFKLTDGSSRKLNAAVKKAGDGSWYEFDYETQEAVIFKPAADLIPLSEWKE